MKLYCCNMSKSFAALALLILIAITARAAVLAPAEDIETLLDRFNQAATDADLDAYLACLAPGGVFIGTDATERWTVDELRAFVKPYFDQGISRAHTPGKRHIEFCPGGDVAHFDELVELESLGVCRGTGVVTRHGDRWLIQQYSLSFPVPNDLAFDVVDLIQTYHDEHTAQPADDSARIREVLDAYLSAATFPDPKPIDQELFAPEIEALWSDGKTYRGRNSVVSALEERQRELGAFESFGAKAEQVRIQRRGAVAWLSCRLRMNGVLAEGEQPVARTVRSSFVFEKTAGRWRIVQEHSSRVAED